MGDERPAGGQWWVEFAQLTRDEFIGKPVEAVAAHTAIMPIARQREPCHNLRHPVVKGRVEAGDLRQAWTGRPGRPDGREVVRLM